MATKLKNLSVKKVDFVDEGACQRADIKLFKRKEEPEPSDNQTGTEDKKGFFKRLMVSVGKNLGFKEDEIQSFLGTESVAKGDSQTFGETVTRISREKVSSDIWDVCYALQSSLQSIVFDEDLEAEESKSMMEQSLSDFSEIMSGAINNWSEGKLSDIKKSVDDLELSSMEKFKDQLDSDIQKAVKKQKGELEDMLKIDKSKMSTEERAAYDDLIKKYAVNVDDDPVGKSKVTPGTNEDEMEEEDPEKGDSGKKTATKKSASAEPIDDIYKGLHPAVKAELEALNKFKADAEERELGEVAKKYEIIGKKKEELVPDRKSVV